LGAFPGPFRETLLFICTFCFELDRRIGYSVGIEGEGRVGGIFNVGVREKETRRIVFVVLYFCWMRLHTVVTYAGLLRTRAWAWRIEKERRVSLRRQHPS